MAGQTRKLSEALQRAPPAGLGSACSIYAFTRFGSSLSVFDFFHLGSSLSVRGFAQIGSACSVTGTSRFGSALSILDFVRAGCSVTRGRGVIPLAGQGTVRSLVPPGVAHAILTRWLFQVF